MVAAFALASGRPGRRTHGMRIIKTNQAFASLAVKCQRIIKPMRDLGRRFDPPYSEPHPVFPGRIDNKCLAVQIE